jgi:hypothetical protein
LIVARGDANVFCNCVEKYQMLRSPVFDPGTEFEIGPKGRLLYARYGQEGCCRE